MRVGSKGRFLCVPCGGSRVTGFTHLFSRKAEADDVLRQIAESGENFPDLRVVQTVNFFWDLMYVVEWGLPKPEGLQGWAYEVAIARQLDYSDKCMPAHFKRCRKSEEEFGEIIFTEGGDEWLASNTRERK